MSTKPISTPTAASDRIGRGQWMALTAALLGWMFDGAEMGVFSMVGRPAIKDLLQTDDPTTIALWFGVVTAGFLVGAATGGVLFGWLGDRIGRVRAMTLSVLVYALFTGLCGIAGAAWQVGTLRFIAALGMGGEWSLGVALVMEVWPNRSRAFMAGLIGAAANVGYLLVGVVGLGLAAVLTDMGRWLLAIGLSEETVQWLVANQGWRLILILGTTPALLTFLIRLFVPESERWQQERERGTTSSWATRDLLGVVIGALGPALIIFLWIDRAEPYSTPIRIGGTLLGLAIATIGYTYPVVRYLQRQNVAHAAHAIGPTLRRMLLGAALAGVALLVTWGATQWIPLYADQITNSKVQAKEYSQIWSAIGAIVGTIGAALLGDLLGRRVTYCILCVTGFLSIVLLFQFNHLYGNMFLASTFAVGMCTASFYGWLPLYLPELFRTNIRATGQGFSFNFGRILAAVGALQTANLMGLFKNDFIAGGFTIKGGFPLACTAISMIYLVGIVLIWFAPETKGKPLPD